MDLTFCAGAPTGLVARPDPDSGGEVLTYDDGFRRAPEGDPNGITSDGAYSANSSGVIVRLDSFRMLSATGVKSGTQDTKTIAITAGDDTNDGSMQVWQIDPASSNWEDIPYGGTLVSGNPDQAGGIDGDTTSVASMPDSCTHPGGAPARAIAGAGPGITTAGNIAAPCWVFTNNVDPVYVYPDIDGGTTYEELTSEFTSFRAVSCETFGDRVYFLNTFESGNRLPQRLRRTARGTADPSASNVGSGSIDMEEFSGQGLRCETLGDVLACYFEDGTAFVRQTGIATVPNEVQVLDERRGLLGTHSVVRVGDNKHFGIFTDGWWLLDSSARWTKVGIASLGGAEVTKWTDTFYATLDYPNRHRIQMGYDPVKNWVRISQPLERPAGSTATPDFLVWIYDLNSDRVWIDDYRDLTGANPTCWGNSNIPATAARIWTAEQTAGTTWAQRQAEGPPPTAWRSLTGAVLGTEIVVHGTDTARVMEHTPNIITKDNQTPIFVYPSPVLDFGEPRTLKTANRICMEYINVKNTNNVSLNATDGRDNTSTSLDVMDRGSLNDIELASGWHRLTDERLGIRVRGSGGIKIRSLELEYFDEGVERIR
jgi:hypothetical protein